MSAGLLHCPTKTVETECHYTQTMWLFLFMWGRTDSSSSSVEFYSLCVENGRSPTDSAAWWILWRVGAFHVAWSRSNQQGRELSVVDCTEWRISDIHGPSDITRLWILLDCKCSRLFLGVTNPRMRRKPQYEDGREIWQNELLSLKRLTAWWRIRHALLCNVVTQRTTDSVLFVQILQHQSPAIWWILQDAEVRFLPRSFKWHWCSTGLWSPESWMQNVWFLWDQLGSWCLEVLEMDLKWIKLVEMNFWEGWCVDPSSCLTDFSKLFLLCWLWC